eukprot:Skav221169  [mRNA]  locus=scaffold85:432278:439753:+ [translate_table: standard]
MIQRFNDSHPLQLPAPQELKKEVDGVQKIRHTVEEAFAEFGVHKMKALDHPFNPEHHEAMFAMEMPGKASGIWEPWTTEGGGGAEVEYLGRPGYMIHDRTLRAAKVGVKKTTSLTKSELTDILKTAKTSKDADAADYLLAFVCFRCGKVFQTNYKARKTWALGLLQGSPRPPPEVAHLENEPKPTGEKALI